METVILGIDHGTSAGYCVTKDKHIEEYGVFLSLGETTGEKLTRFEKAIRNIIDDTKPDIIATERPAHQRNGKTTQLLIGYYTSILKVAYEYKIPVYECYPTSVKKLITGNGKATKQEIAEKLITLYKDITLNDIVIQDLRNKKQCCYEISDSLALCYYTYFNEVVNNEF